MKKRPEIPDETLYLQRGGAEIEQKPDAQASGPEVVYALGLMNSIQRIQRLDLHDNGFRDDQVGNVLPDYFVPVSHQERWLLGALDDPGCRLVENDLCGCVHLRLSADPMPFSRMTP
jgi:hypothetical protein